MKTHFDPNDMTDKDLIMACIQQNRVAQRTLYDRYKRAMYTLAYRLTGDFDDANDVLQDTFLTVFRKLDTFKCESTLGAWIKAILVRNAYRKYQKVKFVELAEQLPDDSAVQWDNTMNGEYLEKAILSLPEGFRMVFTLIEIEGYGHKEVAEMLNISEGTSKSQLFHAKKKLRELLQKN
jgi:RNA polymerase sigma factor (sigma-70 family)